MPDTNVGHGGMGCAVWTELSADQSLFNRLTAKPRFGPWRRSRPVPGRSHALAHAARVLRESGATPAQMKVGIQLALGQTKPAIADSLRRLSQRREGRP